MAVMKGGGRGPPGPHHYYGGLGPVSAGSSGLAGMMPGGSQTITPPPSMQGLAPAGEMRQRMPNWATNTK